MSFFIRLFYFSIIISLCFNEQIFAQQFLLKNYPHNSASFDLRYMHPEFNYDRFESFATGVYELDVSVPVSGKLNLNVLLPFTTIAVSSNSFNNSQSTIGNIYLGLQHNSLNEFNEFNDGRTFTFSFGVYLPTTNETRYSAGILGTLTDYSNMAKYIPNTVSFTINTSNQWKFNPGLQLRVDLGPDVLISTLNAHSGTDFLLHYGLSPAYSVSNIYVASEFAGTLLLSQKISDLKNRFVNSLSLGGGWKSEHIDAGLFYAWNMNDWLRINVTGALGAKLGISLP